MALEIAAALGRQQSGETNLRVILILVIAIAGAAALAQTNKSQKRTRKTVNTKTDSTSANWAGTWLSSDDFETVVISKTNDSITAKFKYKGGDRSGAGEWKNCKVRGNTTKCDWTADHDDSTKTAKRWGTLKVTLKGDALNVTYEETDASLNWKPGYGPHIFDGSMGAGVIRSRDYKRQPKPTASQE
jgi:dipeptidyl aminopeptidase/acylaminoacyl peptidase